jgi:hypothetical protein
MPSIVESYIGPLTLADKPVIQKEKATPKPKVSIQEIAEKWIGEFDKAIRTKNALDVAALFQNDGTCLLSKR